MDMQATKEIDGYMIIEPKVGDVPELFDMMTGNTETGGLTEMVNSMLRNCVYKDGEPLGERLRDVPIRTIRKLITELIAMAGMNEEKK